MNIESLGKVNLYICMALAFIMPIFQKGVPILIILLAVNFLLALISGEKKEQIRLRSGVFTFLIVGFYLFHGIGLIYSNNMSYGLFDMEVKMSFVIFPVIFSFSPLRFENSEFVLVLKSFFFGGVTAIIICVAHSLWNFEGDINVFFGEDYSFLMHLGYFALYLNFCFSIFMFLFLRRFRDFLNEPRRVVPMALIGIFIGLGIFLTTSRMGILIFILQLLILIGFIVWKVKSLKVGLGLLFFLCAGISLLAYMGDDLKPVMRIKKGVESTFNKELDTKSKESVSVRRLIWHSSMSLFVENPFLGVGTGDIKDELIKQYKKYGYDGALAKNLNAHNQFIQTAVALGSIGFVVLTLGLIYILFQSVKFNFLIGILFFIIICLGAMTESILEVQAGVVFYSYFSCIIIYLAPLSKERLKLI